MAGRFWMLAIPDEYTRECLAIDVSRKLTLVGAASIDGPVFPSGNAGAYTEVIMGP